MTKKILFLLTFLLTTLGGGGQLWADTYTLSYSTKSSADNVNPAEFANTDGDYKGGGLTISGKNRTYILASAKRIKYSDSYKYTISGVPDDERIISITFEGCSNDASVTTYMNEFNGTEYDTSNTPVTFPTNSSSTSHTFSGSDITSGSSATFTVTRSSGADGKQTNLIITVVTDKITIDNIYSGTYPYKWDFTVETAKWSKSKSQITDNTNWVVMSSGDEARNKVSTPITVNDIDICKGLTFQADAVSADASSATGGICLDWTTKAVWLNGTVTLPALLRGHTVKIKSSAEPTAVAEGLTRMTSEETAGVYVYRATQAVASPSFTFDGKHIYYIEVSRTTIQLTYNNSTSAHLRGATPTLTLGTTNQYWGNYAFNVIPGINLAEYVPTASPTDILTIRYQSGSYMSNNGGSTGYNYLTLTGATTGTAHIIVTISPAGEHAFDIVGPYEFDVRVVQNATPKKWEFENTSKWTTATAAALGADGTNWQSGTAANEYKNKNKINGTELFVGETKMTETAGLYITAEKGAIQVNPTEGYVRLGNASRANIVIPNAVAEQTITFKVKTATAGKDCGIQAASSNLALISGCVAGDVSYYTFRVTSNGDIKFTQTSSDTDLFIYYIDLKADTPANTGLKFVHGSDDISNTKVNIVSGVTGPLDSYFTLAQGGSGANVTVTVSPSSLITYDDDGTFTMGNGTGTATITARTVSGSVETGIAVLYVSVKNQPTVKLNYTQAPPYSVNYGQDFNNNTSTVTGTSSAGLTVKYKSSNERVATVDAFGHVTSVGVGTATITAYTEETETYLPAEASYQLTYNAGSVVFQFEPSEVKLALGKDITPYLHYDQKSSLNPETLEFTMSKTGIVTCDVVTDAKQHDKKVIKITSDDDASKIGETVIVTARAQTKGESPIWYYTTIAVTITAENAVNFDWVNGNDIYVYENTYFPIPGYTGNASGNNSYSNGSANASTHKAYLYVKNSGGNPVWNTENYKLNEGVPDYYVDDTGKALIFWAKSDKSAYPDTLLVYARSVGTVTLHAKDSQTNAECSPITIHILAKSELEDAHTAEVNTISFPYTWDFTKDFSESDFTNSMFWKSTGSGRYDNTAVWMNEDWAHELGGDKFAVNFLGGTGAGSPIALFKGAQIRLGNSTYNSKIGRIQVKPNAEDGNSHLTIIGGQHYLYLPQIPVERTPNQAYRLYVKAKGQTTKYKDGIRKDDECSRIIVDVDNGLGGYDWLGMLVYAEENEGIGDYIVKCLYCDIPAESAGRTLRLNFDQNVELYWIALTTEAKTLSKFDNTKYWASTYSYTKDLDLSKSKEVHPNVIAHYASAFSGQNEVKLTEVPNNAVPSGTGMLLKATTTDNPGASYFIANAENVSDYSAPSPISGTNYLKANPEVGTKINANTTIDDKQYTNFTLAYRYKVVHAGGGIDSDYTYPDDWSFYRIAPSGITVSNKNLAYLQVPGDLYIDAYSSRRAGDATGANPASQELLKIVFDDDNNTGTTDLDISTVTPQTVDNGAWYTLQGVRVSAPLKGGIYIHNGKKIVVK